MAYILLADDDIEDQEILVEAILNLDATVAIQSVQNGQEVLKYLEGCADHELPALVVLDYKMPILSAADVLERMNDRPRYGSIPKIVWSTSRQPEHIKLCMERGATHYFTKPVNLTELTALATQILEIRGNSINTVDAQPQGI
ncbi:response regulator [Chitinophaga sp. MM2321]|uniref:response regulator n=1 Tax=Chitinophaga sp. MM2321 TaxID=3137178 RepID=UPI0032D59940